MSLFALQADMITMVAGGSPSTALEPAEQAWLRQLDSSRGLEVTRDVHRWWRQARIAASLPLTCKLLERVDDFTQRYSTYAARYPCRSLFFIQEGQQFLHSLSERKPDIHPYVIPLAHFELALRERRGSLTLTMPVDPRHLIDALLRDAPLPEATVVAVRLGPDIERGWRVEAR